MGAWSPSLDGDLDPSIGEWWVGLACALGTSGACVLRYPAGIHWFVNRRFRETIRLSYGLAPCKNRKMKDGKMVLIAQPCLKVEQVLT